MLVDLLIVRNPFVFNSGIRRTVLRWFGAKIGQGVLMKRPFRVAQPWKLEVGDRSWIGENAFIQNKGKVIIGSDAVVSQHAALLAGSHDFRSTMKTMPQDIVLEDGSWVAFGALVVGPCRIGHDSIVSAGGIARGDLEPDSIFAGRPAVRIAGRWKVGKADTVSPTIDGVSSTSVRAKTTALVARPLEEPTSERAPALRPENTQYHDSINLGLAGPGDFRRAHSKFVEAVWMIAERVFVTNSLQPSSGLRRLVLRAFGARIGHGVIIRPRVRVKFPWNLSIGNRCWIGEGVWFHNQAQLTIEDDCCISQETFISTGSHEVRTSMDLIIKPVRIESGAWLTTRTIVTLGVTIGRNAVVTPATVVHKDVPANMIVGGNPMHIMRQRFADHDVPVSAAERGGTIYKYDD